MAKAPEVSVIIPTFNCAGYISAAIRSALAQKDASIEIVVVNDGSTDHTLRVLEEYLKKGQIVLVSQENKGTAAARNRGIRQAQGEHIAFLDADDQLLEGSVQKRLSVCKRIPDIGLVCSDFRKVFVEKYYEGERIEEFSRKDVLVDATPYIRSVEGEVYLFRKEIWQDPLLLRRLIWTGTVMVPRRVFDRIGYFNENLQIVEDIDLWFRICRKYDIGFLNASTADYFVHSGGVTNNIPLYYDFTIRVLSPYLAPMMPIPEEYKIRLRKRIASYYFIVGYFYYERKWYARSAWYFRQALRHNRSSVAHLQYAGITFLPGVMIDFIRKIWRSGNFQGLRVEQDGGEAAGPK